MPIHLQSLTAMRWVAAAMVVLPHLYMRQLDGALGNAAQYATVGVSFFFILSGFVLTWTYRPGDSRRRFYQRRFARIYPLYLTTLLLSIAVLALEGRSPTWSALPFALTMTQSWIPSGSIFTAFNSLSWSLSCEAFFYAIFPFIAFRIVSASKATRLRLLFTVIALVAVKGLLVQALYGVDVSIMGSLTWSDVSHWAGYYFPLTRALEFVAGMLLACMVRDGVRAPITLAGASGVAAAAFIGVSFIDDLGLGAVDAIMFLPVALLVLAGATRDLSGAAVPPRALVLAGQASFAMYMVQELILRVGRVFAPDLFTASFAALAWAALTILVLTAISVPVHLWMESPLERRLRPQGSRTSAGDPAAIAGTTAQAVLAETT